MKNVILMEEQKFETLLSKVEQLYNAQFKKTSNSINEINGFISERDACELIGKSKTWLWRKRTEEMLPFKKFWAKIFYHKNDLFNLLKDVA